MYLASTAYYEDGNTTIIYSSGYPNNYPPFEYKVWTLFSENGFLLEIVHFHLQSTSDILVVQNGLNVSHIVVEKNFSGTLDTNSAYVFDWPYLRMIFISDGITQYSGFHIKVLDEDTTSKGTFYTKCYNIFSRHSPYLSTDL